MSRDQFDGLTRSLASTTSRGKMLKALAGGALAAAAGTVLGGRAAEAATVHHCCEYVCMVDGKQTLAAECVTMPSATMCPDKPGCEHKFDYVVSKCSACGIFG